jgi:hypothetical protein
VSLVAKVPTFNRHVGAWRLMIALMCVSRLL